MDKYYESVFRNYGVDALCSSGYWNTRVKELNLSFLTTPLDKILHNLSLVSDVKDKKFVVLLSTGGFYPLHNGHIFMMDSAKEHLELCGYTVLGGYFSCSHDDYVLSKENMFVTAHERVHHCNSVVSDSDWLMVDPWESLYASGVSNFTEVYARLFGYLTYHIPSIDISVAYVCGSDNLYFTRCFEEHGICVCVDRAGVDSDFLCDSLHNTSSNIHYVENKNSVHNLSSRDFRSKSFDRRDYLVSGTYLIRDEGSKILEHLNLNASLEHFSSKLCELLKSILEPPLFVSKVCLSEQLNQAAIQLEGKNVLSLDWLYTGLYNLNLGRLFNLCDGQLKSYGLIERVGYSSIDEQCRNVPDGNYVLLDDDSVSGYTINHVKGLLPEGVVIDDVFLLSSLNTSNLYDTVDVRDFLFGGLNSGLLCSLPNGVVCRVPYIEPYVDLMSRASIPYSKIRAFSLSVLYLNKEFYSSLDILVTVGMLDLGFRNLMYYSGYLDSTTIVDVINDHIKLLDGDVS